MTTILRDNARVKDHRTCNRYYYFRHKRHIVPDKKAPPLIFGDCWHTSQDVVWPGAKVEPRLSDDELTELAYQAFLNRWMENGLPHPNQMDDDLIDTFGTRVPNTAFFMLGNYIEKRRSFIEGLELLEVEKPFAVPIYPNRPDILYVGRLDKVVRWEGRVWVIEHKSTAWGSKSGFNSVYLDTFSPDSQIDGYMHAVRMLYGKEAKGILIDCALVHKTYHEHFTLIPIERSTPNLDAWLWELRHELELMEVNEDRLLNTDIHRADPSTFQTAYPKNTTACIQFMRPCPYLDICKTVSNPALMPDEPPKGFKESKWEPFDELKLSEIGVEKE